MLKSDLVQTDKHSIKILTPAEKSPIFTSHKSLYEHVVDNIKKCLAKIARHFLISF